MWAMAPPNYIKSAMSSTTFVRAPSAASMRPPRAEH